MIPTFPLGRALPCLLGLLLACGPPVPRRPDVVLGETRAGVTDRGAGYTVGEVRSISDRIPVYLSEQALPGARHQVLLRFTALATFGSGYDLNEERIRASLRAAFYYRKYPGNAILLTGVSGPRLETPRQGEPFKIYTLSACCLQIPKE